LRPRFRTLTLSLALITASPFIGALLTVYWSHYSSQIQRKVSFIVKVKAIARIFLAVCIGISPLPSFYVTVIVVYWIIEFIADPAYAQTMKEIYPGDHRGRAMGYVRTEMALIAVVLTYVGGTLLDLISYRILFPLGAALLGSRYFIYGHQRDNLSLHRDRIDVSFGNKDRFHSLLLAHGAERRSDVVAQG
jgi:hypothetical protein